MKQKRLLNKSELLKGLSVVAVELLLVLLVIIGVQSTDLPPLEAAHSEVESSIHGAELVSGESLALSPSSVSGLVDEVFTMDIVADAGTGSVDTVDAYLDFDPTYLEVVDASGAPTTTIEANSGLFDFITFNSADNAAGEVNFSASTFGDPLTGSFTVATIRFRAKAAVNPANVVFVRSGARVSDLYQSGSPLNATLTNGAVTVTAEMCPDFEDPPDVGVEDIQAVGAQWRKRSTDADWADIHQFDLDNDGIITIKDIVTVVKRLGDSC